MCQEEQHPDYKSLEHWLGVATARAALIAKISRSPQFLQGAHFVNDEALRSHGAVTGAIKGADTAVAEPEQIKLSPGHRALIVAVCEKILYWSENIKAGADSLSYDASLEAQSINYNAQRIIDVLNDPEGHYTLDSTGVPVLHTVDTGS